MKTWLQRLSLETCLFILAMLLGALIRFAALGQPVLGDHEAQLALQALDIVHGADYLPSAEPGYVLLTGLLFFLFQASDFTARLWPAIAGTLFILAAWLVREQIGRKPALILAFLLALDPVLVAASRTAAGNAAAISCLVLAFLLLLRGSAGWAGLFAGLSLLGGPSVWPGVLGVGVLCWLYRGRAGELGFAAQPPDWKKFAVVAVPVFALTGSLFLLVPSGLSAAAGSLVAYLRGWGSPGEVPFPRLLAAMLAYQLPALVFGLVGMIRGLRQKSSLDVAMSIWWAVALVLALAYPARNVLDIAWMAFPMLVLTARQVAGMKLRWGEDRLPVAGQAVISVVLVIFVVYTLLFAPVASGSALAMSSLVRVGLALALLIAITAMVAWGWSLAVAASGLQWGASFLLAVFGVAAVFHAAGYSRHPEAELIRPSAYVASADLLDLSISQTTQWRPNPAEALSISVIGLDSDALRWNLRNYPQALFTNLQAPDSQPDVVISERAASSPELAAEYRGQAMTWSATPAWSLLAPNEWLRWLVYRDVPVVGMERQQIIYWVRSDQFPGGGVQDATQSTPVDGDATGEDSNLQ